MRDDYVSKSESQAARSSSGSRRTPVALPPHPPTLNSPALHAPLLAAGRPLAITLLVVGLIALTVLMVIYLRATATRTRDT